jgi:PAS domain S-box-containing protein
MRDDQKTKAELLKEAESLRKRVAKLTQTEKALRESEEKWHNLLKDTPDIIMIVDRDGIIRFINHTVSGITVQETIGKKVYDFISSEHHEKMRKDLEQVFQTGQDASHEISGTGPHGGLSWYQARLGPIKQHGRIVAASIVARDITDHRLTEDTLRLRNVAIESSINGIAFVDIEGFLIYVNDSFLKLWGYSDEKQVLGKPAVGFWADVDKAEEIREIVSNKGSWTGELVARKKDGSYFDAQLSASLVKDENANPVCLMASFVDITERKNAEQSLRESEERLRVALSAAQMGTWRWDPATNQDTRDASFNGILGLEAVESTQPVEDFLQRVHPEDRDMVDAEIQRSLREHCTYLAEFRIIRPDGTVRWLRDQGKPLYGENDNILYLTGAVIDITEHKRAEDELRESEERYRILVENQTDMVVKFDLDGVLLFVSPSYCKTFGKSQDDLVGNRFMPLIYEQDRERVAELLNNVYKPPYTAYVEERALTKDGWRWQAWLNTAVLNSEKKVEAVIGVGRDITDRKRAEDALRESEKRFREIFENTAVGVYRTTPDGQILMANPALVHMLGYSSFEEISKRNLEEEGFEPQYKRSMFKEEIEREGRIVSSESIWITQDGKRLYVIENARAVRDKDCKKL